MDDEQKRCMGMSAYMSAATGLSIAAIIIGAINFSNFDFDVTDPNSARTECKGAEQIPYYLVVMGTLIILLITLKLFFKVRNIEPITVSLWHATIVSLQV